MTWQSIPRDPTSQPAKPCNHCSLISRNFITAIWKYQSMLSFIILPNNIEEAVLSIKWFTALLIRIDYADSTGRLFCTFIHNFVIDAPITDNMSDLTKHISQA